VQAREGSIEAQKSGNKMKLKVIELELEDVFGDMVRVHIDHRPGTRAGQVIVVKVGKCKIRAIARGSRANSRDVIAMDLETRRRLGLDAGAIAEFSFSKGSVCDEWIWAWHASDATPRVAARVSLLSLMLGLLGLILGVVSLLV
jgi:hypothetical protein